MPDLPVTGIQTIRLRPCFNMKNHLLLVYSSVFFLLLFPGTFFPVACRRVYAYELNRYEIEASLDTKQRAITAKQKVTFTNNTDKPVDALYFHIYPHRKYSRQEIRFIYRYAGYFKIDPFPEGFESGDLKIKSVVSLQRPLAFSIEGSDQTILKITLDAPLRPKDSKEITLEFSTKVPHTYGRLGWHKGIFILTRWYPILSVLDEKGWHNDPYYLYHHPYYSDASFYKIKLTLPREEIVAATGLVKNEKENKDATKTLEIESVHPVRDFSLGISRYFKVFTLAEGGLKINSYFLPGDEKRAKEAAANASELIRFNSQRFGQYPYPEFNIVPAFLGYGGEQSSGQIFIDPRVYKLPRFLNRYFDFLISHETGHQWFYNIIGSDEYRQMFLDEGMNSYWTLQFLEYKYGPDAKVMVLPRYLKWLMPNFSFRDSSISRYLYLAKNGLDRPILGELSSFQEPSAIFALAYGKGAAVLEMLKAQIGEEAFLKIIRRYTQEFRFKNIGLGDFMRICNEESGRDLSWFFQSWLMTSDKADFAVSSVRKNKVILQNRGDIAMPLDIRITFQDNSQQTLVRGRGDEAKAMLLQKKIKKVELDPDKKIILDVDRTNNYWPRKISLKPVPWYFFAYELPLFMPRDSFNGVAGPSIAGSSLGLASSFSKPYDNKLYLSSDYDFSAKALDSKLGYEFSHVLGKQNYLGFEIFDYASSKEENDLSGAKVYLRKELWPASYGLFDTNDHVTFYIIRDQKLDNTATISGKENTDNLHYLRKDEAIFGITASLGRYGPYPDPAFGWKFMPTQEFAGHFLGGKDTFWRSSVELDNYRLLLPKEQHKIASRLKFGWGEASDKDLFQLGGPEGLRGYSRKEIKGAHMLLASLEYRLPLRREVKLYFLDNIFCLDKIQAVGFFDAGKAWYSSFKDAPFKKDLGLGLRFHFDLVGFLEKIILRIDLAQPINEPKEDPHLWFGISHSF